jgi:hypothetical protein
VTWEWPDGSDIIEALIGLLMTLFVATIVFIVGFAAVRALGFWVLLIPVTLAALAGVGWVVAFVQLNWSKWF